MDNWHHKGVNMILRTQVFELAGKKYQNLCELAKAMDISVSQIYRVRQGKRNINQKFLIGAIRAFPEHNIGELFYFTSEVPAVPKIYHRAVPVVYSSDKQSSGEKQRVKGKRQEVEKLASAKV